MIKSDMFVTQHLMDKNSLFAPITVAILFFCTLFVFTSYHIVPPGHRGVLITLGRIDENALPEGLVWKLPFISHVIDLPVMQLKADGKAESYSRDLQNMLISFAVMYRVPDNQVVSLYRGYRGDPFVSLIEPRVQESVKQVVALHRAEDLVRNRDVMKTEVFKKVTESVGSIITISDIVISNIDLSEQLEQAIEQKVVREQEALAKNFEVEKEKKQAEITVVHAEAEAKAVQIKGAALKLSPEVIQFEIAQRWDGKAPLSVSTTNGGSNILLPLR